MTTVQVTSEIDIELDKVLDGVAQLDTADLEQFLAQVSLLLARRKAPNLPKREAELLQKINEGLSPELQQRYEALQVKLQADIISPAEHQEYLTLIDKIELVDAERMEILIELAQLKNISLDELMNQLGIHSPVRMRNH